MDKRRILVIDDEAGIRKLFELVLAKEGFEVETVDSGEDGLARMKKVHVDLVLLDLNMPNMSGLETLRELRVFDTNVPVYIVTVLIPDFLEQLRSAAEEGLNFEIITKPIGLHEIVSIVKGSVLGHPVGY